MPITCSMPDTSKGRRENVKLVNASEFQRKTDTARKPASLPRVLERVFDRQSTALLRLLVERSLNTLSKTFYSGESAPEIADMRALAAAESHTTLLALFFLLLNVDIDLKEHILTSEDPSRRDKLVRFMLDLRQHVTMRFFTNDATSPAAFVDMCREFYLLA